MNWRDSMTLIYFVLAAVIFAVIGWFTLPPAIQWAAPAVALGLISVGLGVNSLVLVNHTDRKIEMINEALTSIKQLQEKIQEEQKEQQEQSSSGSPIASTLQAFTQFYLDYLAKQESGAGEQNSTSDDIESSKGVRNETEITKADS